MCSTSYSTDDIWCIKERGLTIYIIVMYYYYYVVFPYKTDWVILNMFYMNYFKYVCNKTYLVGRVGPNCFKFNWSAFDHWLKGISQRSWPVVNTGHEALSESSSHPMREFVL